MPQITGTVELAQSSPLPRSRSTYASTNTRRWPPPEMSLRTRAALSRAEGRGGHVVDSGRDGAWNLYEIHPDGTGERRLPPPGTTPTEEFARHPGWSPD